MPVILGKFHASGPRMAIACRTELSPWHQLKLELLFRRSLMVEGILCQFCGTENATGSLHCSRCGRQITSIMPSRKTRPDGKKGVDRTRGGIAFLILSSFLIWLPLTGTIGIVFGAIGASLVIIYRGEFGRRHGIYPIVSAAMFISGLTLEMVLADTIAATSYFSGNNVNVTITGAMPLFLGSFAGQALVSLSFAMILYALMNRTGRIAIWCGVAAGIAINAWATYFVYVNLERSIQAISGSQVNYEALESVAIQIAGIVPVMYVLLLIPPSFYAVAYFVVLGRIRRKELPVAEAVLNPDQ